MTPARYRLTTIAWLVIASLAVVPAWSAAAMTHSSAAPASHHASLDDDAARTPCSGEPTDPASCNGDLACAQFCSVLPVAPFQATGPAASAPPVNVAPADSSILVRPPHLPPKA